MLDEELMGLLKDYRATSIGALDSEVGDEKQSAMDAYMGELYGDEEEGRSQVIDRSVAETVDWMMPDIMRTMASGEESVSFSPRTPEDELEANQALQLVNHIFWIENDGFNIIYDWAKSGLIEKNGFAKVWWEEEEKTQRKTYTGQSILQVTAFEIDESVEIIEQDSRDLAVNALDEEARKRASIQFPDGKEYDITISRELPKGRIAVASLPTKQVTYAGTSRSLDTSPYVNSKVRKTISDIISEGLATKKEALELQDDGDGDEELSQEFKDEGDTTLPETDLTREVWVNEEYVRVDFDDDGIAEFRKVISVGSTILDNEEIDEIDMVDFTPNRMPNKITGVSVADQAMDIQRINTVIMRQSLDSLYQANDPQTILNEDQATENTIDDLLTPAGPNKIVRVQGDVSTALANRQTPFVGNNAFQMLEYMQGEKERRTGITRMAQGIPADAMAETATATLKLMAAAQSRKELIIRQFANSLGALFQKIYRMVKKHQDFQRTIRLSDEFVLVDPRDWASDFDIKINVGLGTGDREQKVAALGQIIPLQIQALDGGLSNQQRLYNSAEDLTAALGLPGAGRYFVDPSSEDFAPPEPQKTDAEVKAASDQQIAQLKSQADLQKEQMRLKSREAVEMAKIQSTERIAITEMQREAELTVFEAATDKDIDTNVRNRTKQ